LDAIPNPATNITASAEYLKMPLIIFSPFTSPEIWSVKLDSIAERAVVVKKCARTAALRQPSHA
jgi:hypothetical protein